MAIKKRYSFSVSFSIDIATFLRISNEKSKHTPFLTLPPTLSPLDRGHWPGHSRFHLAEGRWNQTERLARISGDSNLSTWAASIICFLKLCFDSFLREKCSRWFVGQFKPQSEEKIRAGCVTGNNQNQEFFNQINVGHIYHVRFVICLDDASHISLAPGLGFSA